MKYFFLFFIFSFSANGQTAENIQWHSFENLSRLETVKQKKVFIDVYTDWCGWCKRMDENTFKHPVIIKLMTQYFYAVKLNAETSDTISYKGLSYKKASEKKQSPNEFAVFLLNNKMSYPTTVYLDENLNSLGPVPGYLEPKMLEKILHYFGENSYKTTPWIEFEKQFIGEIK